MNDLVVRFPPLLRALIEEVAREEFLPTADATRSLVQKAILQRQLQRGRRDQPK